MNAGVCFLAKISFVTRIVIYTKACINASFYKLSPSLPVNGLFGIKDKDNRVKNTYSMILFAHKFCFQELKEKMALKVYTQWELLLRIDLELNVSVECFSRVSIIHFVKLITLFTMTNWKILKKYVIFCVWFSSKLDIGIITLNYFVMPQRAQQLVPRRKWNMSSFHVVTTVKNTVSSPNFLEWKFCGKAQLPHSFGQFARIMWNYGLFSSARSHFS